VVRISVVVGRIHPTARGQTHRDSGDIAYKPGPLGNGRHEIRTVGERAHVQRANSEKINQCESIDIGVEEW
jgi:hypothetical protein